MASIIDRVRDYLRSDDEYEVDEYVLERRTPDANPRVRVFDTPVTPGDVRTEVRRSGEELPSGTYLLQEIKHSGMAGDVVWTEELSFDEDG